MNQCVPGWDVDDNNSAPSSKIKFLNHSPDVPSLEYEVAELTWENGQVAMHGLGVPRVINKVTASPSSPATWDKPRAGGTLESIVNQATCQLPPMPNTKELVPWIEHHRATAMTMDALVPCNNNNNNNNFRTPLELDSGVSRCSTRVGSCRTNGTVSNSGRGSSCQMTINNDSSWERELMGGPGFTSTYTTSGQDYTKTSADDRDSISHHTRSHGKADDEGKRRDIGKSSVSTKRSRAAAIHNQSERKRRDKINQRMKTLQKLVPSSSKSDKASMLDEVIEYLKQLQAQVHVMSRMNMPSMMLMQQQLQMSMMGMGMGMGVAADHCLPPAASLLMPDPLAALLACQSQVQPMTMDAYTRLAAMYQQLQQQPQPAPPNN